MIKIDLPIAIVLPRKTMKDKVVRLNLNVYRNMHYMVNNIVKQTFKEVVSLDMIDMGFCPPAPLRFTYTLFYDNSRPVDVSNVLSIVDKFASDSLTECKIIQDDYHKIVGEVVYRWGGVDKENPRATLEITSI